MKMPREFNVPKGAMKVADRASTAVAYLYTNANGEPCAAMFGGKRSGPDRRHYYKKVVHRDEAVADYFKAIQATEAAAKERRAERKSAPRGLVVGDICNTCWGYDQTNREFYQVTKLIGAKMIEAREIAQTSDHSGCGYMTWRAGGIKDDFIGEPFRAVARNGRFNPDKFGGRYSASLWDGTPCHASNTH